MQREGHLTKWILEGTNDVKLKKWYHIGSFTTNNACKTTYVR